MIHAARFWSKVDTSGECWTWTPPRHPKTGYGSFWLNGRQALAHRVAYEMTHGEIPAGLQIDHLCRTRACVRPDHLEAVTPAVNVRRGVMPLRNASKTECPAGHPYNEANTYVSPGGRRDCRACSRVQDAARRAAKRAR